jgi:2-hydroxycyclohexanecarboxyl-CoA dehydrogenase
MTSYTLAGGTALVTGGARGMGARIATWLAAAGAKVAILDILADDAEATATEIGGVAVACDLTDPDAIDAAYAQVAAEVGDLDIVVNCAGWDKAEPFVRNDPAVWDRLLAVNLRAPIQLTHLVLPGMMERGRGRLIFIGSDAGRVGSTGEAVYSACKGGVIAFAKTVAREAARSGVTSNTVCPGPTDTVLFNEVMGDNLKLKEALKRAIPLGRLGDPDDIAAAVFFLATAQAGFITGQTLSVSGGLTMS